MRERDASVSVNLRGRSLLKEVDFTKEEFLYLVDLAAAAAPGQAHGHRGADAWSAATSP